LRKGTKLDLRLTAAMKRILQRAAEATNRTLSQFVLDNALARADEVLAERRRFVLSAEKWDKFQAALDAPARSHPRMKRLLNEPSIFEK
jgi:uncharacterized protein (DUF1778 family)